MEFLQTRDFITYTFNHNVLEKTIAIEVKRIMAVYADENRLTLV